jgi:hypothetical protein
MTLAAAALFLGTAPRARADDKPDPRVVHLQISLYELREAKEDIREVSGLPDREKLEIQGSIDNCLEVLKKTIEACGGRPDYVKPAQRPNYPNFKHLRHAITAMKTAREQLKTQEGVPDGVRADGLAAIDKTIRQLERALDHVK